MDLEKRYKTVEGVECNILQLVKMEPEWAANRIQAGEKAEAALKLVEGQKPPTKSDYAAAIRCYNEWEALLLANKNCSLNFLDHCKHRLNPAKAPDCA